MPDIKNIKKHLENDQAFPATREELIAECDNLSDFSEEDKKWFEKSLPEGTYNSPDEVMMALGLDEKYQTGTV